MVKRVLVTGGNGMLGSHLVRRLHHEGFTVSSVDLRCPTEPMPGVTYHRTDVRHRDQLARSLAGVDTVVHTAAALPSYPADEIRSVIVEGTTSVLAAAARARVERVVHVSSTAVYGLPTVVPTTEEHPREPVDTYSRAKVEAERVCERYRDDGLCVPILRPKTFLGPGRLGLFAMLFEWAEDGRNFPVLGSGDVRIQMLGVADLVEAVVSTVAAPVELANDTYNLAAAEFGSLREEFQRVLDTAGHGKRVVSVPARPAVAVLRVLQRSRLSPVYGRLLQKLLADSYVSIDKARERLDFAPRLSNSDAIAETFRWWREHRAALAGAGGGGRTSREPWRQGVLGLAKALF